jgi:hypothetical protein
MSDRTVSEKKTDEPMQSTDMPGGAPTGEDLHEPRGKDRVITSAGIAPTGGIPVGGAADRVQPDRTIPMSATGAEPNDPRAKTNPSWPASAPEDRSGEDA